MATLKNLALVVPLLAGGTSLAMIGFLAAQQIIARQVSAPGIAPTASTPADQIGQVAGVSGTVAPRTSAIPPCDMPDGLGLSRIVQIDKSGGPEFGAQRLKGYDFLRDKEIVLTFDDGPWLGSTEPVLKALASECLKSDFL